MELVDFIAHRAMRPCDMQAGMCHSRSQCENFHLCEQWNWAVMSQVELNSFTTEQLKISHFEICEGGTEY